MKSEAELDLMAEQWELLSDEDRFQFARWANDRFMRDAESVVFAANDGPFIRDWWRATKALKKAHDDLADAFHEVLFPPPWPVRLWRAVRGVWA
jgi:hypothetical protein